MAKAERPVILICISSGYVLKEMYLPLIKQMASSACIYLLVPDYFLTQDSKETLLRLKTERLIEDWNLVETQPMKESRRQFHQRIAGLAARAIPENVQLIVTHSVYDLFDKYLHQHVKDRGIEVIAIQTGTIWRVLDVYRRVFEGQPGPQKKMLSKLKEVCREIMSYGQSCLDHLFWPLIVQGRMLSWTRLEGYAFVTGGENEVLCYEPTEMQALKKIINPRQAIRIIAHPSTGYCRCQGHKEGVRKLLLAFGGCLNTELSGPKFDRWVEVALDICRLAKITQVDIRIHPRTNKAMRWPERLKEAFIKEGIAVGVIDRAEYSMMDVTCQYIGVLGSPSGSLRVAQAVCGHVFVCGMPDCSDESPDDQDWILGEARGIYWIAKNGSVPAEAVYRQSCAWTKLQAVDVIKEYLR